jgi:hypothetical protein
VVYVIPVVIKEEKEGKEVGEECTQDWRAVNGWQDSGDCFLVDGKAAKYLG